MGYIRTKGYTYWFDSPPGSVSMRLEDMLCWLWGWEGVVRSVFVCAKLIRDVGSSSGTIVSRKWDGVSFLYSKRVGDGGNIASCRWEWEWEPGV